MSPGGGESILLNSIFIIVYRHLLGVVYIFKVLRIEEGGTKVLIFVLHDFLISYVLEMWQLRVIYFGSGRLGSTRLVSGLFGLVHFGSVQSVWTELNQYQNYNTITLLLCIFYIEGI